MTRAICVWAIAALGCVGDGAQSTPNAVRDSAGVTIVDHEEPDWSRSPSWFIADTPAVVIGVLDGEEPYQLFDVSAAARAADGRIYILNRSTAEVRVFDATGRFLNAMGRLGSGPGEFRYPSRMWLLPGDSVTVWDAPMGPRVVFAPDGSVARIAQLERELIEQLGGAWVAEDIRPLPNGAILAVAWREGQEEDIPNNQLFRPPFKMVLVAPDLTSSISLGTYGGLEQMFVMGPDRRTPVTTVFSPHYHVAIGGAPTRIVLGDGDRYELHVHDGAGVLRQIIRRSTPSASVTASDLDTALARRLRRAEQQGKRQATERLHAALPEQLRYPAHGQLEVDREGNVWVQEYRRPSDVSSRWTIYDIQGRMAGTFATRKFIIFAEIGSDHVLAIEPDENGVERVVLYQLLKREMGRGHGAVNRPIALRRPWSTATVVPGMSHLRMLIRSVYNARTAA